jgi:hypothetical protein
MTKAFTKGQEVTHIAAWNRSGTVYYRDAIVHSCGKVQMVLTDAETGEEMGRHFHPGADRKYGFAQTFPRMTKEEAVAKCLEVGAEVLVSERAHFARCLASNGSEGYNRSIQRDLDALPETPAAVSYYEAHAAIVAAIRNKK